MQPIAADCVSFNILANSPHIVVSRKKIKEKLNEIKVAKLQLKKSCGKQLRKDGAVNGGGGVRRV